MILSKSDYLSKITSLLPDNSTQQISPEDLRESLVDLVDSVHMFLVGQEINTSNFSSPDTRTTIGGDLALEKINLVNRVSVDNTAYGYYALGANFVSSGNTAVGSYALGCNLQGTHNTAIGLNALGGNVNGSGNIGIGNFSLLSNKHGDYNIAIGHGAGHFVRSDDNLKFFLGAYPGFDQEHTCDIVADSGKRPLLYGELDGLRLGVAVPSTHTDGGSLQVSGDATPFASGDGNLGTSKYAWHSVNEALFFSGGKIGVNTSTPSGSHGVMTVDGHLVPNETKIWSLGHDDLRWDGWFNDVHITGQLEVFDTNYHNINECLYDCKTLHLATSGFCDPDDLGFHNESLCGYLTDESLDGAGFEIHSSGTDYRDNYFFLYRFPDTSLKACALEEDNKFSRARWQSNISLEVTPGRHVQTDRVLGPRDKLSLVTQSGCFGLGLKTDFSTAKNRVDFGPIGISDSGFCGKDFNFLSASGDTLLEGNLVGNDLSVMFGSVDSGVKLTQQFSSRIKSCSTIRGFRWVYHDEFDKPSVGCDN
jgi:hypothetical protein